MKLHLPTGLRKALLACLAAFALPATTFASASSALGAAALVAFMINSHASAASSDFSVPFYWDEAYEHIGNDEGSFTTNTSFNINDLLSSTEATALTINGLAGYQYTLTGGSENIDLKFIKTLAGGKATIKASSGTLVANNVFFTGATTGGNNNLYQILGSDTNLLSGIVGTIYVQQTGLLILAAQNMQAGFSIGSAVRTGNASSTSVLQIAANVTTTGNLEVQQDTGIDIVGATFTVSELTGEGDLKLGVTAAGNGATVSAGTLVLSDGGDRYGGALNFAGTSAAVFTVQLGDNSTLRVAGIKGDYGKFSVLSGEAATLRLTGTGGEASNITFAEGITLEFSSNASQTLTDASIYELQLVDGGTLTLKGTSSIHIWSSSQSNSNLTLGDAAYVTIEGVDSSSGLSMLSMGNGAVLDLTGSKNLQINTLSVAEEGTATIRVSLADSPQIRLSSYEGGTLLIELTDEDIPANVFTDSNEYDLINGVDLTWDIRLAKEYRFGRRTLTMSEGLLTLSGIDVDVVWKGGDDGVWSTGGVGWDDGEAAQNIFLEGDKVVFDANAYSNSSDVTLSENITATSLTIKNGEWIFRGVAAAEESAASSLTTKSTSIAEDSSLTIAGDATLNLGTLSGSGSFIYQGGSFSVGDASAFSGTLRMEANYTLTSDLTLATGGKVVLAGQEFNIRRYTLRADVELETDVTIPSWDTNGGTIQGDVIVNGHVLKSLGGLTIEGTLKNQQAGNVTIVTQMDAAVTVNGNITEQNNITELIAKGSSAGADGHLVLNGNVSGVSSFKVEGTRGGANGYYVIFGGGLTISGQTTFNAIYGGDATSSEFRVNGSLSGDASAVIVKQGAGKLNLNGNLSGYAGGLNIENGTVNITSAAGFSSLDTAANSTLTITGATLSVTNSGTHTLNGALTYGTNGRLNLTLENSSKLILGKALNVNGDFTVNGTASLQINVASISTGSALTLSTYSAATFGKLSIGLNLGTGAYSGSWSFNLLGLNSTDWEDDDAWNTFSAAVLAALDTSDLHEADSRYSFRLSKDGVLSVHVASDSLTWDGGNNGVWEDGCSGWVEDGETYVPDSRVNFLGEEGSVEVAEAGVSAASLTVQGGGNWTFSGGSLSISGDLTVGSEESAAEVSFGNVVNLAGDIILLGEESSVSFTSATLGTEAAEISGDGHVVFTSLSRAAAFTGTGLTISGGATVEINNTTAGNKNLGGVNIGSGCTVILNPNGSLQDIWGSNESGDVGNSYFYGEGSLVLAGTGHDTSSIGGGPNNIIGKTLKAGSSIAHVYLGTESSNISMEITANSNGSFDLSDVFDSITNLHIANGSALSLKSNASALLKNSGHVLHIAGYKATENNAALNITCDTTIAWDVKLSSAATIHVGTGTVVATVNGAFIGNSDYLFTKKGAGTLKLLGSVSGGSDVTVQDGTLLLNNAATDGTNLTFGKVNLSSANSKLSVGARSGGATGDAVWVGSVAGSGQLVTADESATLKLSNAQTETNAAEFTGTTAAALTTELTSGAWKFGGTANGALSVSGGSLILTGGSINKGLTATGGTVKLAGAVTLGNATVSLTGATLSVENSASLSIAVAGYRIGASVLSLTADQLSTLSGLSGITLTNTGAWAEGYSLNLFSLESGSIGTDLLASLKELISLERLDATLAWDLSEAGVLSISAAFETPGEPLVWNGGVSGTWSEGGTGWEGEDDPAFVRGGGAIFRSGVAGDANVIIDGAGVTAGSVAIESGMDWAFTGGTLTIAGDLTVGSAATEDPVAAAQAAAADFSNTVILAGDITMHGEGSSVTFSGATTFSKSGGTTISGGEVILNGTTAGMYNLGNVTIGEGATLRIHSGNTNLFTNTKLSGDGCLILEAIADTPDTEVNYGNYPFKYIGELLYNEAGHTLHELYLAKGGSGSAIFNLGSGANDYKAAFGNIEHLYIEDGVCLRIAHTGMLATEGNTLHLTGSGAGTGSANNGALNFYSTTDTINWDVQLESDSVTIRTEQNGTLAGTLNTQGHTLVKTGGADLTISGSVTGSGKLDIQAGKVKLNNAASDGENVSYAEVTIGDGADLSVGADRSGGVWIGTLTSAGSTARVTSTAGATTLKLKNNLTEATATEYLGTTGANATVELTSGAWKFGGTANGALSVSGGSLILTGGSINGGLTATGGTVKLAGAVTLSNATVSLTGATLSVENSASLSIAVAGYGSGASVLSLTAAQLSELSGLSSLTLTNTAWAADYSLNLFNLDGGSISADLLASLKELISLESLDASQLTWDLSDTGVLSISAVVPPPASELVWVDGSGTWSAAGNDAQWADDAVFSEYADVTFGSDGATGGTVQIVGDEQHHMLSAGNVTIAHGTFTFDLGEGNALSLMDMTPGSAELTINSGATLILVGERDADGKTSALSVMGRIVLNGTLEIGSADVELTIAEFSGALENEGCITGTNAGAVFRLNYETDGVSNLEGITFSQYAGSVQISAGSFNLDSRLGSIGGKVVVDGSGSLQVAASTDKALDLGRESAGAALTLGAEGVTLSGAVNLLSDTTIAGYEGEAATLSGALDGGGNNLTLSGGAFALTGTLSHMGKLTVSSNTVATLNYSGESSDAVFTEVALASGDLTVGNRTGGVVIGSLSGSGAVHAAADSATLKLVNSLAETSAAEFTGAIDTAVTTELASGAWKFNGTANGALRVSGGSLILTGGSLNGGLATTGGSVQLAGAVSLSNATVNLAGAALSVENGASLSIAVAGYQGSTAALALTAGQVASLGGSGVQITLTGVDSFDTGWTMQLLDIVSGATQQSDLDALAALITNGADLVADDLAFALSEDGVLSVISTYVPPVEPDDRWVWTGDDSNSAGDMVWDNESDNWNQTEGDTPNGKDVYFEGEGTGSVSIRGTVSPRSIWVKSGSYEFSAADESAGSLSIGGSPVAGDGELGSGVLAVGSGDAARKAELKLSLKNTKIDQVNLLDGGTLTLNHANALTKGTDVVFSGGTLAYDVVSAVDVSARVSATDGNIVRIRVGADSSLRVMAAEPLRVVWGSERQTRDVNSGINLALTAGVEKTGAETFALEWSESTDARLEGSISALQGTVEYVLHAADRTVTFAGAPIQIGGNGADACVIFSFATGAEGSMALEKTFTGSGTAQIGSATDHGNYLLAANNSDYAGTIRLVGDSTAAGGAATAAVAGALGGAQSTLALAGRSLTFGDRALAIVSVGEIVAEAGSVTYIGGAERNTANEKITLAAPITGNGTLANATGGFAHTITGDVSGFTGVIVAGAAGTGSGAASTWTLRGEGGIDLQANFAGTGSIVLDYAGEVRLTGRIGADDEANNSVSLETPELFRRVVIADVGADGKGKNTSTGALVGEFYLGDAKNAGTWAGQTVDGYFELANGRLLNPITTVTKGSQLTVETAKIKGGATVNAGGTAASLFEDIVIHAGGHLTGVSGTLRIGSADGLTATWLYYGAGNVGNAAAASGTDYLMDIAGGAELVESEGMVLDFSAEGFVEVLEKTLESGEAWLHTVHGGITIDPNDYVRLLGTEDPGAFDGDSLPQLLRSLGFEVKAAQGGDIILTGDVSEVYLVLEDETRSNAHEISGYNVLSSYKATVVDEGQTLTLALQNMPGEDTPDYIAGGIVVNNLVGLAGSNLHVKHTGESAERVTLVLSNETREINKTEGFDEVRAQNTTFKGTLKGEAGVDLVKTGAGTLTIGDEETGLGGLQLKDGSVSLQAGALRLVAEQNTAEHLIFAGEASADKALILSGEKTNLSLSTVQEAAEKGGSIYLQQGATLTITSSAYLEDTILTPGDDTLGGKLSLAHGAKVELASATHAQLEGVAVEIADDAVLSIGTAKGNTLTGLTGSGELEGRRGAELILVGEAGEFSGSFSGSGELVVGAGASFSLVGVSGGSADAYSWSLHNSGSLVIDVTSTQGGLWLEELTLGSASTTTLRLNTDRSNAGLLGGGSFSMEQGAELIIEATGEQQLTGGSIILASFGGNEEDLRLAEDSITLRGSVFLRYTAGSLHFADGKLVLDLMERKDNAFITPNMQKNARAGATMAWNLTDPTSAGWSHIQAHRNGALAGFMDAVQQAYDDGRTDSMASAFAAAAGASAGVLSSALAQDVERQMNAMRNRSAMAEPAGTADGRKNFHLWLTGETAYHKLDADGMAPGFTLNGWGGSVGADVEMSARTMLGLSISAMYNDLKTSSADSGRGDMDTTYLSAYARTISGAWTHTFVATIGTADVTLNRTVSYDALGSYASHGSTDGFSAGVMYEVGYSFILNRSATVLLQPVFNVQYSHASISGYTETGTDAALRVNGMEQNLLTLGLGARLQSAAGANAFNRLAVFEARALVKAELGDRSGSANTSFASVGGPGVEVEGAETGAVGVEVGAGFSLPLGQRSGSIFVDGSAEFRSGYSNVNASAGYRINF